MQIFVNSDADVLVKFSKRVEEHCDVCEGHDHHHDENSDSDDQAGKESNFLRSMSTMLFNEEKDKLADGKRAQLAEELKDWNGGTMFYLEQSQYNMKEKEQ